MMGSLPQHRHPASGTLIDNLTRQIHSVRVVNGIAREIPAVTVHERPVLVLISHIIGPKTRGEAPQRHHLGYRAHTSGASIGQCLR